MDVTHNNLPEAVALLLQDVKDLNIKLEAVTKAHQQQTEERLLTLEDAANYLGITVTALRQNNAPRHKRLNKLYFFKGELDAWVRNGKAAGRKVKLFSGG